VSCDRGLSSFSFEGDPTDRTFLYYIVNKIYIVGLTILDGFVTGQVGTLHAIIQENHTQNIACLQSSPGHPTSHGPRGA